MDLASVMGRRCPMYSEIMVHREIVYMTCIGCVMGICCILVCYTYILSLSRVHARGSCVLRDNSVSRVLFV